MSALKREWSGYMKYDVVSPDGVCVARLNIDEDHDIWEMNIIPDDTLVAPVCISLLRKRGVYNNVPKQLVKMFVADRVFPPDRQNITEILHAMGLVHYSITGQLNVTEGRCDRDNFLIKLAEK